MVVPQRRSSASSWQILISHMFGDASGPYILGLISDAIRGNEDTAQAHYKSLVTSFWLCVGTLVLSVILFGISAITVVKDKARFNEIMCKFQTFYSLALNQNIHLQWHKLTRTTHQAGHFQLKTETQKTKLVPKFNICNSNILVKLVAQPLFPYILHFSHSLLRVCSFFCIFVSPISQSFA